jgi:hypothetical protein
VIEQARAMVDKPDFKGTSPASEWQIQSLYERVFARVPEQVEVDAAMRFVAEQMNLPAREEEVSTWQYGWGGYDEGAKKLTFEKFKHFKDKTWQAGPKIPNDKVGFASLRPEGGHVGRDARQAVIRRWVAPADTVISIAGVLTKPSEHGDAVIGRIIARGSEQLASYTVEPKGNAETRVDRLEVKKGDTIDFLVEAGATDNSDSFAWAPLIQSDLGEWDAKLAFAGPPPARPAPLTAWEKYAQVLLATNEFVFVD